MDVVLDYHFSIPFVVNIHVYVGIVDVQDPFNENHSEKILKSRVDGMKDASRWEVSVCSVVHFEVDQVIAYFIERGEDIPY